MSDQDTGFLRVLVGDGRPLLSLTAIALVLSGAFALFLSATGSFLPHDVAYLGMAPAQLCAVHQCRVVHFMFHDRVSFGGVLIAIGILYLWITHFPLARGQEWAWWTLVLTGAAGFASFLAYLGYGYLDTWHGTATLAMLPCFLGGMWKSHELLPRPRRGVRSLLAPAAPWNLRTAQGLGRLGLLLTGCGKIAAGSVIMTVGMTRVFVPQDLTYIGLRAAELRAINPRLLPLIAHDRAGFGGGLLTCGLVVCLVIWKSRLTPALWQAVLAAGGIGFGCAIGVHFSIGYLDVTHLAPAVAGACLFAIAIVLAMPSRSQGTSLERLQENRSEIACGRESGPSALAPESRSKSGSELPG